MTKTRVMNYREMACELEEARKTADQILGLVGHNNLPTKKVWELIEKAAKKAERQFDMFNGFLVVLLGILP